MCLWGLTSAREEAMKRTIEFTLSTRLTFISIILSLLSISTIIISEPASAQVKEEWVARYNGLGNGSDQAAAIAVDTSGNAYVTGSSTGSGTGEDYATIKYDANGNELWVARYNSPNGGSDEATALAIDAAGNVYITGSINGFVPPESFKSHDYGTIKYDSSGNEMWIARYNGPGDGFDRANAVAVDGSGNVYITGSINGFITPGPGPEITSPDYGTVKYDANGNELWVAVYNGPTNDFDNATALAVDTAGNAYVTGSSTGSGTGEDYATIKYDANGNELWVARYNGPGNGSDQAIAIAVDTAGNAYVTGNSTGSGTGEDYVTIKYDANGNELWVASYNGPGNGSDQATAIAVDTAGNAYVTGSSTGSDVSSDYITIKYDTNGNELWVARYNGPGNYFDIASAIAVDEAGNSYVTGDSSDSDKVYHYTTIKYDGNGHELWLAIYNGPDNSTDTATALTVDTIGNVYVTGSSVGTSSGADYATIKLVSHSSDDGNASVSGGGGGGICFIDTIRPF